MIKVKKDGRTVRTGKDYTEFRESLHLFQSGMCLKCERQTSLYVPLEFDSSFHVHHKNGRGMGGSKRDDTFEACDGLCGQCHRKEHNQE